MDGQLKIDRTVNLNTIIGASTFVLFLLGGLIGATLVYSKLQAQAEAWSGFQERQEQYNSTLSSDRQAARAAYDVKLEAVVQQITKLAGIADQSSYQIAQLQKKDDETDARLGRMSESYSDKFTEIQTTLSSMNTQLALQSQALAELKQVIVPHPLGK